MSNSLFYYCIPPGGSLYIFSFLYMYIFGPRVLISIHVLFITVSTFCQTSLAMGEFYGLN
jgi:hypothetical protein